jgi:hypothetical protein
MALLRAATVRREPAVGDPLSAQTKADRRPPHGLVPSRAQVRGEPSNGPGGVRAPLVRRFRVLERLLVCGRGKKMSTHIADEIASNAPLDKTPVPVAPLEAVEIPAADDGL